MSSPELQKPPSELPRRSPELPKPSQQRPTTSRTRHRALRRAPSPPFRDLRGAPRPSKNLCFPYRSCDYCPKSNTSAGVCFRIPSAVSLIQLKRNISAGSFFGRSVAISSFPVRPQVSRAGLRSRKQHRPVRFKREISAGVLFRISSHALFVNSPIA